MSQGQNAELEMWNGIETGLINGQSPIIKQGSSHLRAAGTMRCFDSWRHQLRSIRCWHFLTRKHNRRPCRAALEAEFDFARRVYNFWIARAKDRHLARCGLDKRVKNVAMMSAFRPAASTGLWLNFASDAKVHGRYQCSKPV